MEPVQTVTYAAPMMQSYAAPQMTYAQPVRTVMPTTITQMPHIQTVQQYPMTTAVAPVQMMHTVPTITQAVAPTFIEARQTVIPSDRRLLAGQIIGESPVSRDELIRQGRLIPDEQREGQLLHQAASMPGYMDHHHPVGVQLGNYSHIGMGNTYAAPASVSYAAPVTYAAPAPVTYAAPEAAQMGAGQEETLEISFLRADGLHHMNFTGDNMWACCEVVKHSMFGKTHKCQSETIAKTMSPEWNEMHHLEGYHQGDNLKFTVYDQGVAGSKTEGSAIIDNQDFYPNGFEGELPLQGLEQATVSIRIVPLGVVTH